MSPTRGFYHLIQLENWPTWALECYYACVSLDFLFKDGQWASRTERRDFIEPKSKIFMMIFMLAG